MRPRAPDTQPINIPNPPSPYVPGEALSQWFDNLRPIQRHLITFVVCQIFPWWFVGYMVLTNR